VLVIAVETGSRPAGQMPWAGRRHDDDTPGTSSGTTPAELFDAVFGALHDGEQVALGFDVPLSEPVPADQGAAGSPGVGALLELAGPAMTRPGVAELGQLLGELGTWRPWTRISTSLSRWKANTSILVWEAVPGDGADGVAASAAADSFFRQLRTVAEDKPGASEGPVVNLAAVVAQRAGLLADASELARPAVAITVAGR
jgi:hypothetical protein